MGWQIEYWDGSSWVTLAGRVEQIVQELNGAEYAEFTIANNATNREIVAQDRDVRILFDNTIQFKGILSAVEFGLETLKCIVYNKCYEQMKTKDFTGSYNEIPARTILSAICAAAGVAIGTCPTTSVSVRFKRALCFDAATFLAETLNKDFWSDEDASGNPRFNIGDRVNSTPYPSITPISWPTRGIDRSKKRDKVIIRGTDADGKYIEGSAGTGTRVAVFTEPKASDVATLNSLAAKKLAELNKESSSVVLPVSITQAYNLFPGYFITLNKPELNLSGDFRIFKITKKVDVATLEVDKPQDVVDKKLQETKKYEDLGVYAVTYEGWGDLISRFGPFPSIYLDKRIWKVLGYVPKSLIPIADITYDLGAPTLRWKNLFVNSVYLTEIGPYSDTPAVVKFRTKDKAGNFPVDHHFQPSDNEYGIFGTEEYHWKEVQSKFLVLYRGLEPPYGGLRIKVQGEANPRARLTEELLEFGPGGDSAADVYLKRIADNTLELKAQKLLPKTDNILELGSPEPKRIAKIYASSLLLPTDGFLHIMAYGEDNPKARLTQDTLAFGSGGASAPDTWLKRVEPGKFELNAELLPPNDNSGYIGSATKRFAKIYAVEIAVSNMLFNFNLIPDADNTYDLGVSNKRWRDLYLSGAIKALDGGVAVHLLPNANATYDLGSSTMKWNNLYVNGVGDLGWLNVGGYTVITNTRVLQNVMADAAIITSGQFPLARLPRGTAGYVLEAQGANYDPMYVNPNGRYTPASHNHAAGDITSGVFAEDRCPHVYSNSVAFNGGLSADSITTNYLNVVVSVNCTNWVKSGDYIFANDFRITEAEKLGFEKGLVFLDDRGRILMRLDAHGNLYLRGKVFEEVR